MGTGLHLTIEIEIEIELELEPGPTVRGRVSGPAGEPIGFTGWLELHSLLEELSATTDEPVVTEEGPRS